MLNAENVWGYTKFMVKARPLLSLKQFCQTTTQSECDDWNALACQIKKNETGLR